MHTGAQFSLLQPDPKKGSKMGAKMQRFALPNPNYTHFGAPFVRKWCPKSCIEKRLAPQSLLPCPTVPFTLPQIPFTLHQVPFTLPQVPFTLPCWSAMQAHHQLLQARLSQKHASPRHHWLILRCPCFRAVIVVSMLTRSFASSCFRVVWPGLGIGVEHGFLKTNQHRHHAVIFP